MSDPEAINQPAPEDGRLPPPLPTRDSGETLEIDFHPEPIPRPPRKPENYYRRMMRQRMPWFVVPVLFLVWAAYIAKGQLSRQPATITPSAIESSLIFFDRNLKIEENIPGRNKVLRWVLDDSDISETLESAADTLESYEGSDLFDQDGRRALAVIREVLETPQDDLSKLDDLTADVLDQQVPSPNLVAPLISKLKNGEGRWWDQNLGERLLLLQPDPALEKALESQRAANERLFNRAAISGAVTWVLPYIGLLWLPYTIRVFRRGWTIASLHRTVRYGSRWEPSLVVALFLAADLLAALFYWTVDEVTADIPTGFAFFVGIDTLWRLLSPGLALVILFRKPGHAIRSLGLNKPVLWKVVFAMYAVLSWVNYGFNALTSPWAEFNPADAVDLSESGWEGLFYGLLSACVIAPIVEEIFYRGILLRGLERRFGFWISASVVSLAFALGHFYDVFGLISVGILGFAMVVIYRTTGSLTTLIVLHALYNLTITLPQWLLYHSK